MSDSETSKRDGRVDDAFGDPSRSSLEQYMLLAVGTTSLGALLVYELMTLLASGFPGALGYWLRRTTYRWILGGMGRGVTIGRNVTIRGGKRITLGDGVFIDDQCVLDARGKDATITIEDGALIARNTIVRARNGTAVIESRSDIGCNCIIGTDSEIRIGKDVLIAAFVYIVAGGNHVFDNPSVPIIQQGTVSKGGIRIGDGAWIGARVTVLDGATIGPGAVVGSHALVTGAIPPMTVAVGTPAKVVRER